MTTSTFAPYTTSDLRDAFATRRSTPEAVVLERATQARRLRVGLFSPEGLERKARWDAMVQRDEQLGREIETWFAANQDSFVWIVGTNHDVPVADYLEGAANVRLCLDADCCDGVLETFEQREERLAIWAKHPEYATPIRDIFPYLEVWP